MTAHVYNQKNVEVWFDGKKIEGYDHVPFSFPSEPPVKNVQFTQQFTQQFSQTYTIIIEDPKWIQRIRAAFEFGGMTRYWFRRLQFHLHQRRKRASRRSLNIRHSVCALEVLDPRDR
jgi:hypothetical protein